MLKHCYYYFRNRITFSETLLSLETAQMQLCHSCALCARTAVNAFGDLVQNSANDLRRRTAESYSNFHGNGPNAFSVVRAHKAHE